MLPKRSRKSLLLDGLSGAAAQQAQKESPSRDRSCPGAPEAVTKLDPCRLRGFSPNSRRSRRRPRAEASSHPQDRVASMEGSSTNSIVSFVGIDVSKTKFDVVILPDGA